MSETGIVEIIVQFSQHDRFAGIFFKRKKRREPHQTPSLLPRLPSPLRVIPEERQGQERRARSPRWDQRSQDPLPAVVRAGGPLPDRIHRQLRGLPSYFYPSYLKAAGRAVFEVTATRKRRRREEEGEEESLSSPEMG